MNSPSIFTFAPAGERPPGSLHRIAIVGCGAGGLELAIRLGDDLGRRGKAEIVLVDPQPAHLWKPLLHEVTAGTLAPDEGPQDFLRQARRHHFRFHLGAMSSLDRQHKEVFLEHLLSFVYHDRGSVISLGQEEAVGNVVDTARGRTLFIEGLLARLSYWTLYRRHLAILLGYKRALLAIVAGWFAGRTQSRVKLHLAPVKPVSGRPAGPSAPPRWPGPPSLGRSG